jgi:hypothetical protein
MGIGLSAQGVNMNRLPGNNIHICSAFYVKKKGTGDTEEGNLGNGTYKSYDM